MNEFFLIFSMALVTLLIRYPVLAVSGRIQFSPQFLQILRYIPPAVLTAIVVPAVLIPTGTQVDFSYTNARLIGAVAAVAIGFWRKNLLLTITIGMIVFLGYQWVLSQ